MPVEHPQHTLFQKILPLAPFLFILHVASGNGQDPSPSFPWHLAPAELGVMPLPIVIGGHDGQAMSEQRKVTGLGAPIFGMYEHMNADYFPRISVIPCVRSWAVRR